MKVTATVDVRCPRCGADPIGTIQLTAAVNLTTGTFTCPSCGGVGPLQQAVRLVSVGK